MISLKDTIIVIKKKIKKIFFLSFFRGDVESMDKKLVYSLSDHKIPSRKQLKYIKKFLTPREYLVVRICLLLIIVNAIYLGGVFIDRHIKYVPKDGGEYTEGLILPLSTTNPIYAVKGANADVSRLIYSSLFYYDSKGELKQDLVDSYRIENKGKDYIIKLKNNVKWQNGKDLTADDVVYTFNLIKNEKYKSPLREGLLGAQIKELDKNTIRIDLDNPSVSFPELLTFGILPKDVWQNTNPDTILLSELNVKAIGSGPYKLKSLTKNRLGFLRECHLVVNNDYYGPHPHLQDIIFKFYNSYTEAIDALNNNQIDGLGGVPINQRNDILGKDALFFHELEKTQIISIFFNSKNNTELKNKNIRQALAFAIDRESISNDLYDNTYKLINGPILNTNFAYNNNLPKIEYNMDKAKELLGDKEFSIKLTVVDDKVDLADRIKYYWDKLGIDTEIVVVSKEQIEPIIKQHNFEALIYGENVGGDPDIYAFWHSSQINNGFNLASYSNKEVDKLLTEARTEVNREKRIEDYKKIQEKIVSDFPVIFLYSPSYTYLQSKQIKGFDGTTIVEPSNRLSDIVNWYRKTKKNFSW